jgi:hypothetical protein
MSAFLYLLVNGDFDLKQQNEKGETILSLATELNKANLIQVIELKIKEKNDERNKMNDVKANSGAFL